jgi:hypothetical protein
VFCSLLVRVTATFSQRDGNTLHIRKSTTAEPQQQRIYDALGISHAPGGILHHKIAGEMGCSA